MMTHQFTLIVEGPDLQADRRIDELSAAGCDDALVGCTDGVQYLDFDRDATSLREAILSAVSDVERVSDVEVVRIADAGVVSMADIASRTDRTRESVRLLVAGERGPGGFPPPLTDPRSRYRLWRWYEVERWFVQHFGLAQPTSGAHVVETINAAIELRYHHRRLDPTDAADLNNLVELLLGEMIELVGTADVDTLAARVEARKRVSGTTLSAEKIVELRDAARR